MFGSHGRYVAWSMKGCIVVRHIPPIHLSITIRLFSPSALSFQAPAPHPAPLQCHRTTKIQKRERATYHIDSIDCLLVSKILEEPGDDCCNSENTSSRATFRLYQSSRHRPLMVWSVLFESVVGQDAKVGKLRVLHLTIT